MKNIKRYGQLETSPQHWKMIHYYPEDIGVLYEYVNKEEENKAIPRLTRLREIKRYYPQL
jgi:hypothetical protein